MSTQKQIEARRKTASARRKVVYVYDQDYDLKATYASTVEAASQLGLSQGTLVLALRGYIKTYKGLIFSYEENLTQELHEALLEAASEKRERFKKQQSGASYAFYLRNHKKCNAKALDCYYKAKYGMTRDEFVKKLWEQK